MNTTLPKPEMIRGLGSLPSPDDYRDGIAAAGITAMLKKISLPETHLVDFSKFGVFDQQQQIACVSNTVATKLKQYHYRRTGKVINFSPRFGDIMCKRFDGLGGPQYRLTAGTWARIAFKIAAKYGWATEATLPNTTNLSIADYRDDRAITAPVLAEAAQYKIPGYVRIPNEIDVLRAATRVYEGVSVAMYVGPELWTAPDGRVSFAAADISPMRTPKQVKSGHQMILKGWVGDLNRQLNSWGDGWGDHGEADYNAADWDPYTMEAWTIATMPADVSTLLASLPSPTDFHYRWNRTMLLGEVSEEVKFLQVALMILGLLDPVPADQLGIFGKKTAAAIGRYQQTKGIKLLAPYSAGPLTRAFLNEDFSIE